MPNKLCECGCGKEVRLPHHRFLLGHHLKVKKIMKSILKKRSWYTHSEETRKKIGLNSLRTMLGKKLSETTKLKLSLANRGKKNPNYGRKRSEESKKKTSVSMQGKNKGKIRSEEFKRNLSLKLKGKKKTEEHKRNIKLNHRGMRGKKLTEETKRKISKGLIGKTKGRKLSIEHRKKLSRARQRLLLTNPEVFEKFIKNGQNIVISKPQRQLFKEVKKIFPNAKLNFRMNVKSEKVRCRFIDVFVPTYNLAFEFDCSYWHRKEGDEIRDSELLKKGLKIIHYVDYVPSETELRDDLKKINFVPHVIYKMKEV